jgi:YidC/Oxa1 family membrane protein insertase
MEKRAILAIGLSILVFLVFQHFHQKRMGRQAVVQERPPVQSEVQEQAPVQSRAQEPEPAPRTKAVREEVSPVEVTAEDTDAAAQAIVVEGDIYRAVIDNRGAVLTSWKLKDYKSEKKNIFEMIAGNRAGETLSYPGAMFFDDAALTELANNEFYEATINGAPGTEEPIVPPVAVDLKLRRGALTIEKRYSFIKDNYLVSVSTVCENSDTALSGRFLLGQDIGPESEHFLSSTKLQAVYYSGGKVRRESAPKDEKEIKQIDGDVRWAGLDMHYFSMIAIPEDFLRYFNIQKHPITSIGLDGKEEQRDLIKVTLPTNGSSQYQIYIGPKKQSNLEAVRSADISGVVNYGMLSILVHPLLASLRWIYQYVHNYGCAIILLTLILSLLLFPFRLKQMLSMKKMQAVQPKVKAIQEKYRKYKKTDPKRAEMNQEIMALYKQHNVNPLGGCLPLILQMPLLFAFYRLLMNSIELRQAPFIGWVQDLSAKDPYFVLPLVMGATMFISQKMTPMTPGADQTQAKMMMLMPVVFTVMFLNVSSGLNLYFLCSNIFQVGFQKITERWMGDGKTRKRAKS